MIYTSVVFHEIVEFVASQIAYKIIVVTGGWRSNIFPRDSPNFLHTNWHVIFINLE